MGESSYGTNNQWFAGNNRHALKLTTELREDWYSTDLKSNQLGTFSFQSLADLEAGTPSQFTRQLANIHDAAKQLTGDHKACTVGEIAAIPARDECYDS